MQIKSVDMTGTLHMKVQVRGFYLYREVFNINNLALPH
jgi:hypothetical protein